MNKRIALFISSSLVLLSFASVPGFAQGQATVVGELIGKGGKPKIAVTDEFDNSDYELWTDTVDATASPTWSVQRDPPDLIGSMAHLHLLLFRTFTCRCFFFIFRGSYHALVGG